MTTIKTTVEDKLERIADIWNYFIWDNKFCANRIKRSDDVKTNYFGDILCYFLDTLNIVFTETRHSNYIDKFSFTISFLQAIYIQQDLTQEMLEIFKTNVNKGNLKLDPNYFLNRDLRNELIGHPIRKTKIPAEEFIEKECDSCGKLLNKSKNKLALLSSTLFSSQQHKDEIQYLLYHKKNKFEFESITIKISDIQRRHREFLEKYFDVILAKLKSILDLYLLELDKLENVIEKRDFDTVLKMVELYFESIFHSNFVYDKASLCKIHDRRDQHRRYQNFIGNFYNDLHAAIADKRNSLKDVFEKKVIDRTSFENLSPTPIELEFATSENLKEVKKPRKDTYQYEIGKIATKRNLHDFELFGGMLRSKCQNNDLVLCELEHMEHNISDEIEYYTSLQLICAALGVE